MSRKTTEELLRERLEGDRTGDLAAAIVGGLFLLFVGYLLVQFFILH